MRRHKPIISEPVKVVELNYIEKTPEESEVIMKVLSQMILTKHLPSTQHEEITKLMVKENFPENTDIIKQGEFGDKFYIIMKGHCKIVKDGKVVVADLSDGGSFGDWALLYKQPRAATVTSTSDCECYSLTSMYLKSFLLQTRTKQIENYQKVIRSIKQFDGLQDPQVYSLASALQPYEASDGTHIIEQGEEGDTFYILEKGTVEIFVDGKKVAELHTGNYFGEQALIHNVQRNATVVAKGHVLCAITNKKVFNNLINVRGINMEEGRRNN